MDLALVSSSSTLQHACWKEVSYKMRFGEIADARNVAFSIRRVAPNLARQAVAGWSRAMLGSCSHRPSIATRVFTGFLCTRC